MNSINHVPLPATMTLTPPIQTITDPKPNNKQLLDLLAEYILDSEEEKAIDLLQTFDSSVIRDLLAYRAGDKDGDPGTMDGDVSMLALACSYSMSSELISLIASKCPDLLKVHREYPYEGQTPFHTLVSKENFSAVGAILQQVDDAQKDWLLTMSSVTDRMAPVNATVMLGGLPLSIAALTYNLGMVDLLLQHGAEVSRQNDRGDTVFHSLVRFSALYPEKEAKAKEIMTEMHQRLKKMHEPRSVWLMENKEGLTALKLAAQCTQPLLFNFIVTLKGVYCDLDEHDGLFDSLLYDITDIDPVAHRHVTRQKAASVRPNQVDTVQDLPDLKKASKKQGSSNAPPPPTTPPPAEETSILEIIYETDNVDDAFKILDNHVVHRVIQEKWRRYEPLFIAWTLVHLARMVWLTTYAVYKSRVVSSLQMMNQTLGVNNASMRLSASDENFVYGSAWLSGIWSVALLLYELTRLIRRRSLKKYLETVLFHHNGFYRLQLMIFAVALLADDIVLASWYWTGSRANNYCLIVALLVGWWFTAFFLRPWKKFSFFTVMVQEVLIGDMLRFSTIFIPQWLAFSIAMYMTFTPDSSLQGGQALPRPQEFRSVGRTMMTMFKLMLGLADVEVLYDAPEAWLAILLFVLYVLLTYSLMLNALIALMSNTCSIVSQNRENQWKLQRMSIVLFLQETLWGFACLTTTGEPRHIRIEDLHKKQTTTTTRFVMKISSVRGGDGGSVLQHAVKNLAKGEAGDVPGETKNEASSDVYDLLAALNFQRMQKLKKMQQEEEEQERRVRVNGTVPKLDTVDSNKQGQITVDSSKQGQHHVHVTVNKHRQTLNTNYVNIRNSIQKMSQRPRCLSAVPPAQADPRRALSAHLDEPDGRLAKPSTNGARALLNTVPEIHPIPQPNPKIVLLPSPCMITSFGPDEKRPPYPPPSQETELNQSHDPEGKQEAEVKRSRKMAKKKAKFRQRPDSAELEKKFRERREKLVRDREGRGGGISRPDDRAKALTTRPGSGSSAVGHGVFPVEESRIHMHTELHK